jgi:hypothetical protein
LIYKQTIKQLNLGIGRKARLPDTAINPESMLQMEPIKWTKKNEIDEQPKRIYEQPFLFLFRFDLLKSVIDGAGLPFRIV